MRKRQMQLFLEFRLMSIKKTQLMSFLLLLLLPLPSLLLFCTFAL